MALAPLTITEPSSFAGGARRVELTATATVVVLDDGRRLALAARPDAVGARRCRRAINHIASVRIEGHVDRPTARVRGLGNRLPVDLAIPLPTALALVGAGVPAVVHLHGDPVAV